jgi:hypothetical protein
VFAFTPYYATAFKQVWGLKGAGAAKMVAMSRNDWVIAAARGGLLFALLWSLRFVKRPVWLVLAALFVVADLWPVVQQLNPRMPSRFFRDPPAALAQLPAQKNAYRLFHEADWYGQEPVAQKYFSTGNSVYWIVRNGLYPMTSVGWGLNLVMERDYDKTALLPTIDFVDSVWDIKRSGRADWWRPAMAMSNAWYRATYKPFAEEQKRVNGRMSRAQPIQFIAGEKYPRYYLADQLVTITDRHDFANKLSHGTYSDRTAFVHGPSFVPAAGIVRGYRETANTAVIDVESEGNAFLVMSVTPHKYWRVTIDGRSRKPEVTNIGFQGVRVPAGRHRVEMRYRNDLAAMAAKVSALAVLLLAAAAFAYRR